ncbi:MAG: glycosyltransferase [Oscillospiraceae bacterium]|jgi:glycosyltransferase involved in cell wall biosynthesis|nr:glycosyltransferase [Oscillospiraceae bacterium]
MKICFITDAGSVHTAKWCRYFVSRGHEVHVVSLRDGELEGVQVHSLHLSQELMQSGSLAAKLKYLAKAPQVRRIVKRLKPDIIHAHYATSYGMVTALAGVRPFYLSVWGSDVYEFPSNALTKAMIRFVFSQASWILSTSKDMAKQTAKFTKKPILITPFGVEIELFKPAERAKEGPKIVLGCVKKLEEHYGIQFLLKAFAILCSEYDNLELRIAGYGPMEAELKQLAEELGIGSKVLWLGFVSPQEEVIKLIQGLDIAAVPSLSESFGVSAIEASACGIPVVASNVGGLPETVLEGATGLLVPPSDEKALATALKKLIESPELRRSMGERGRAFVCENYSFVKNFNEIEGYYLAE